MKAKILFLSVILAAFSLASCGKVYRENYEYDAANEESEEYYYDIKTSKSAVIPKDGSGPVTGFEPAPNPDKVITFTEVGQRIFVKNGSVVNFIYDGIDPDENYVMYESADGGYYLTLTPKDERIRVHFKKLCQIFVVGRPDLTIIDVPKNLRYEQIVWTPRADGTWELRIGTTQRGCSSEALNELQKMRTKKYERNVPK